MMILKSLKLTNIRSYSFQEINFSEGSLLLAGDIGSGKSTILYAIEFALFGAKKTDLPAHTLLRHGTNSGTVELSLRLNEKEVIINRNLKRGKNGISQESGFVVVDGVKKEGTHVELKTMMLDLLGYPKDLVSKSKDLVYRYTVYTPQEEMKRILLEKKEDRLDTLRKVFNIDKYKRIRENAANYIRNLKEKRRLYEGSIQDLEEKKKEIEKKKEEIEQVDIKINEILPKLEEIKAKINQKRELIRKTESRIEELNKLKRELDIEELNLRNKLEQREKNKEEIEKIEELIKELQEKLGEKEFFNLDDIKREVKLNQDQANFIEKNIRELNNNMTQIKLGFKISKEMKEKVLSLSKCPTCQQDVSKEHKDHILSRESNNISKNEIMLRKYSEEEVELNEKLKQFKDKLEMLKKKESSIELFKLKLNNIEDKKKEKESLQKKQEDLKKDIGEINVKKLELNKKIEDYKDVNTEYKEIKQKFDELLIKEKDLELKKTSLESDKKNVDKIIKLLQEDVDKKLEIKEKLTYVSQMQNWLENYFMNLMINMEKHVMLRVYNEFNELFKEWFNILMEDEGIQIRIDEEFTPIIEQNGYETFFENLSGGEKTAVALSYRLALNKVINDVAGEIKTKNIIMLDEPTDGFSTEQLDKMREVLEQLNMKQVIIVSHEEKIESFVDDVLRVKKEEHISSISS